MKTSRQKSVASIHGRFQPFHNGHLNYLKSAFEHADFIYIGITQVNREYMRDFREAPHRSEVQNNPLSFFERSETIRYALDREGIDSEQFSIIPFPIEMPKSLSEYYPVGFRCITTDHTDWNIKKINLLKDSGYLVEVLQNPDKWNSNVVSATEIRKFIRASDPQWKNYVPAGVSEFIEINLLDRF